MRFWKRSESWWFPNSSPRRPGCGFDNCLRLDQADKHDISARYLEVAGHEC